MGTSWFYLLIPEGAPGQAEKDSFEVGLFGFEAEHLQLQVGENRQELSQGRLDIAADDLQRPAVSLHEPAFRNLPQPRPQGGGHRWHAKTNQAVLLSQKLGYLIAGDQSAVIENA